MKTIDEVIKKAKGKTDAEKIKMFYEHIEEQEKNYNFLRKKLGLDDLDAKNSESKLIILENEFIKSIKKRGHKIKEDLEIFEKLEKFETTQEKINFLEKVLEKRKYFYTKLFFMKLFLIFLFIITFLIFGISLVYFLEKDFILGLLCFGIGFLLFIPLLKIANKNKAIYSKEEIKARKKQNNNFWNRIGMIFIGMFIWKNLD